MGPILPPTNLDVLLLMGRVPGSSAVAASRYEFILIFFVPASNRFDARGEAVRYFLSRVGDDHPHHFGANRRWPGSACVESESLLVYVYQRHLIYM